MGIRNTIAGWIIGKQKLDYLSRVERLSGTANPDQWLIDWVNQGAETSAGEHITEENALHCPTVKAAVSVLAESLATLSLEIYKEQKSGTKELANDHPLQPLLDRAPNPEMTDVTWRELVMTHLCTYGNHYSWIQRTISGNKVVALYPRSPKYDRTHPTRDAQGNIIYAIRDAQGQTESPIPAKDMLHIPYLSMDGILGKSPVTLIREAIAGNKAAERFANELFRNGDVAAGYLTHPGILSEPAYERLKKSLGEGSQHNNRHRKTILEEGMTFEGTAYNLQQLQMVEIRQFLLLEIARAYRITPHLLQDLTGASFSNVSELGRQFVIYTLLPWCARWTSEINRKLLVPPFYARFNFSAFLAGDPTTQAALHRTLWSFGAVNINEVRHASGFNPIDDPNADKYFVPMNMVELSKATEEKPDPQGGSHDDKQPGLPPIGDGVTDGDTNQPKDDSPKDMSAEIADALLTDTVKRMSRIVENEATRAAKDPKTFLSRLDVFLTKHKATATEAFVLPVQAVGKDLNSFTDEYITKRADDLLRAAECPAKELQTRVADTIHCWREALAL